MTCPNSGHSTYPRRSVVKCVQCGAFVRVITQAGAGTLVKHEVPV